MQPIDTTPENSFWQRQAITIKGIVIFILMLVLLIPTSMVESLIYEREGRQREAVAEISGKWGQSQTISGPVLVIPYQKFERGSDGKMFGRDIQYAYFLPDQLTINGTVNPEKRHRGIFEVVLYSTNLTLEGSFPRPVLDKMIPEGAVVYWDKATLTLGIPDLRGLKEQVKLLWNEQSALFDPGIPVPGVGGSGINVPLVLSANDPAVHHFHIDASLKGSGALFFTPLGKVTDVKLSSPWPDPSFTGAFLDTNTNLYQVSNRWSF